MCKCRTSYIKSLIYLASYTKTITLATISSDINCTVVWNTHNCSHISQVITQTGITWNLSPVGKVMPKEWKQAEEEE